MEQNSIHNTKEGNKIRKVFLDELPRKKRGNSETIDWNKSIGYKVKFIYDYIEGILEIISYSNEKLKIKYNGKEYDICISSFKKCNLGTILELKTKNFKVNIGQNFKNIKRNITITDRVYKKDKNNINRKWYNYRCNKCNHYEWMEESNLLKGYGCPICANKKVFKGYNDIATTNPELVKYFINKEDAYTHTKSSNKKALMKCPDCGYEKDILIYVLSDYGFSCPKCGDRTSYPEKVMFNLLEQLHMEFITQYNSKNANWCDKYKYDFYFEYNNEEYIIETHGEQHYCNSFKIINSRNLKEEQQNDENKRELAIKSGIKEDNYIVIDCRYSNLEFIKENILKSRLCKIFDLNNIDWVEIETKSQRNLVKQVCDYWNNKQENETTKDLAKMFKINRSTVIEYLKKGDKLNWCKYDAKEESLKWNSISGKTNGKSIEVFKNGISKGIYASCCELERCSEKDFGVKLANVIISRVCSNKIDSYKGFTFKYVNE